ncbi:hypothetical protein PR048_024412 [Dryococelus australis]|uniref:Uncharacterized protein n=1 Tax=Dryococelus australis TaxID=614101 RepID=A0ABQ9GNL0_9NEOP|nr:hypothetical protein PR048_024412 [Dryococelus australis]
MASLFLCSECFQRLVPVCLASATQVESVCCVVCGSRVYSLLLWFIQGDADESGGGSNILELITGLSGSLSGVRHLLAKWNVALDPSPSAPRTRPHHAPLSFSASAQYTAIDCWQPSLPLMSPLLTLPSLIIVVIIIVVIDILVNVIVTILLSLSSCIITVAFIAVAASVIMNILGNVIIVIVITDNIVIIWSHNTSTNPTRQARHDEIQVGANEKEGHCDATVAQWLTRSPPTKAIRVRSPEGSSWTMPLAGGFSRGTPASPALAFQRRSILGSHFMLCSGMFPARKPVACRLLQGGDEEGSGEGGSDVLGLVAGLSGGSSGVNDACAYAQHAPIVHARRERERARKSSESSVKEWHKCHFSKCVYPFNLSPNPPHSCSMIDYPPPQTHYRSNDVIGCWLGGEDPPSCRWVVGGLTLIPLGVCYDWPFGWCSKKSTRDIWGEGETNTYIANSNHTLQKKVALLARKILEPCWPISAWQPAHQLAAQPIGNLLQHAVANKTVDPFPELCTANQKEGRPRHFIDVHLYALTIHIKWPGRRAWNLASWNTGLGPVAPSWFETLSEIGSEIDTDNCCTIRVQSWIGDRDEGHFEPLKLAVPNHDPRSAAIVDKCSLKIRQRIELR